MDRLIAEIKVDEEDLRKIFRESFDGMTNGQVVMHLLLHAFPNVKAKTVEDYCGFGGFSHHIDLIIDNWVAGFPIEWWEERYEGGKK